MDSPSASKLDSHRVQLPFIKSLRYLTSIIWHQLTKIAVSQKASSQYPIRSQSPISIGPMPLKYFSCVLFVISCKRVPFTAFRQCFSYVTPTHFWLFFSIHSPCLFIFISFPALVVTPLVIWGSHELCHRSRSDDVS